MTELNDQKSAKALHVAKMLSTLLGSYLIGFGVMLLAVGLFTGPEVLGGAMVHLIVGLVFMLGGRNVDNLSRHFYWSFILTAAMVLICGLSCIIYLCVTNGPIPALVYIVSIVLITATIIYESLVWRILSKTHSNEVHI